MTAADQELVSLQSKALAQDDGAATTVTELDPPPTVPVTSGAAALVSAGTLTLAVGQNVGCTDVELTTPPAPA